MFNERLKKFLDQTIPLSLKPVISQIGRVASCLGHFQDSLCKQFFNTNFTGIAFVDK